MPDVPGEEFRFGLLTHPGFYLAVLVGALMWALLILALIAIA